MNPVCTVEVSQVAATGAGDALLWAVVALVSATVGLALFLVARRRARGAAALLTVGLVAAAVAGPQQAAPAQAAASDVVYSAGCTLIAVDEQGVEFSPLMGSLVPGDDVVAITVPVENRFAGTVELSGEVRLGSGALEGVLSTEVRFGGAPGPVSLPAGASTVVTVHLALPAGAGDALQGESIDVELVLTASEV